MIGYPMGLFHDENEPLDEFEEAQTMCDVEVDTNQDNYEERNEWN
jgi:hypothetical protein